jgi:pilus assembly protein CpaB
MSRRVLYFLFTAALGLTGALLVHNALTSKEAKIASLKLSTVRIVVAAHALNPGDTIDAPSLGLASWPRDDLPPGAFSELQAVAGKVVKQSISAKQPIVADAVLEPEKTGGVLPLLIPPGMRAMAIAVDDVSDLSGFVLPHSRVDVLVSVPVSGGPANQSLPIGQISKIVLQNIPVLAVAQSLESGPDQPHEAKVVTLLVSPLQSERLAAASRLGTLTLSMRNFADREELATSGVSIPILLGVPVAPVPTITQATEVLSVSRHARPLERAKVVEVIRNGTDHQTVNFIDGRRNSAGHSGAPPADLPVAGPSSE